MKFYYKRYLLYCFIILAIVVAAYFLLFFRKESFKITVDANKNVLNVKQTNPNCDLDKQEYKHCSCDTTKSKYKYVDDKYNKIAICDNYRNHNYKKDKHKIRNKGSYDGKDAYYSMWSKYLDNIKHSSEAYHTCDKPSSRDSKTYACLYKDDKKKVYDKINFARWHRSDDRWDY